MQTTQVAFLIIGNEILSGRTREKNLSVLAELLAQRGAQLAEARVVADRHEAIGDALNHLRTRYDYVFTSGGIGPTHDDITTDAVAAAFAVAVHEDRRALSILDDFYRERGIAFTAARRRMARLPTTATVVESDFPGAPAYRNGNVFVCAGVPAIFQVMATAAVALLPAGATRRSDALRVEGGESVFAEALGEVAAAFPLLEIGSYPRDDDGVFNCHVVFSGESAELIAQAKKQFTDYLRRAALVFEPLP